MTRPVRTHARLRDDERGSVAVLFCFIVLIAGVLVTGLVDAGTAIQAANRADTYSAEAARAASIAVGPVPTGGSADAVLAVTAARSYLDEAGATGTVDVLGPGVVQVSVTVTASTPLLGIPVSQTRTHTAQLLVGVTQGEGLS
jgi:Flp pilus assembly protein TadG